MLLVSPYIHLVLPEGVLQGVRNVFAAFEEELIEPASHQTPTSSRRVLIQVKFSTPRHWLKRHSVPELPFHCSRPLLGSFP